MNNSECKLLVIDDEPNIIRALKRIFSDPQYTILTATVPALAMNILNEQKIDVILCDQQMPGMLGIDILKHAKIIQPDAVRILITGSADMRVAISAINEGSIYYFFTKPWNNEEMVSVVKKALQAKSEQEEKNNLYHLMNMSKDSILDVSNKLNVISEFIESNSAEIAHAQGSKKIPVIEDDTIVLISMPDIYYVAAADNNVSIITKNGVYKSNESLNAWEAKLGQQQFFRCHRGYIVNIDRVEKLSQWFNGAYNIRLKDVSENIPVSRSYVKKLREIFSF